MSSISLLNSCQSILNQVRMSSLNYSLQETPFTLYLTIRKSFVRLRNQPENDQAETIIQSGDAIQSQSKLTLLETEYEKLKQVHKEALEESEAKTRHIVNLEKKVIELGSQLTQADSEVNEMEAKIKNTNRALQIKHEKVCAENKILKCESEDSKKEINKLNISLKTAKKESKEISHNLSKKTEALDDRVKMLLDYKIAKDGEERDLKRKIKQADKKLKLLQDREAKIKIEKTKLEKLSNQINNNVNNNKEAEVKKEVLDDKSEPLKKVSRKAQAEEIPKPDFSCVFCEEEFGEFSLLITHIKTNHRETKSYKPEAKDAKDPTVENIEEKWAHLIPEERVVLEHFQRILNEVVSEAVAVIENPTI